MPRESRSARRSARIGLRYGGWAAFAAVLAVISILFAPAVSAEWSAPRTVWVEPAGHTVDGLFLDKWRANELLLGAPITEEFIDKVEVADKQKKDLTVQYFENLALVYSPNDSRGQEWYVYALPLGAEAFKSDRRQLRSLNLADSGGCGKLTSANCRRFEQSGHTIRWGFKEFWEANGAEQMIGLPLTEEFVGSDGWTTQYFERVVLLWKRDEGVKARAIGTEIAKQQDLTTKKIAQPVDVPIYDEELFIPPVQAIGADLGAGPGPVQGGYKEIVVSISQQSMWAYEDGVLVASSLVSTGVGNVPETVTPTGYFSVLTKYELDTMDGTINDEYYNVPDVPWVMYFDNNGDALHGAYWHNNFGTPMSHGCVNLPLDVAEYLYGWAPIGTPVTVID